MDVVVVNIVKFLHCKYVIETNLQYELSGYLCNECPIFVWCIKLIVRFNYYLWVSGVISKYQQIPIKVM